ncbi:hypothetical protein BM1_06395 [Bipolaris maydis]|nr:hypothetical protein BM1_06395 [Bipolaris maydis]
MPALACLCQSRRGAWRSTHADAAPQTPAAHGHHGHENANGRCAHDACGHVRTDDANDDAMMGRRAMHDARRREQTPWFPLSNSLSLSPALSPATPACLVPLSRPLCRNCAGPDAMPGR